MPHRPVRHWGSQAAESGLALRPGVELVPGRGSSDPSLSPRVFRPVRARQRNAAEQPRAWSLDLRRALVVDGEVWFRGDGFDLAASGVLAELARDGDGYRFTLIVESTVRGTAGATLGEAKLSGRFSGAEDVTRVAHAPLSASGQLGNSLHFTVNSPSVSSGVARVDARGTIDLSQLAGMLPALPNGLNGSARIEAAVVRSPATGWTCESLNLTARDVSLINGG